MMRVSPLRLLWPTQVRAASPLSFSSVASRLTYFGEGPRFFRHLLPAVPLVHLTAAYRLLGGHRAYRVPLRYQSGLGPLYSPVALGVHERTVRRASTRHSAFWLKPVSILGLFWVTTFIKRSHVLTIPLNPSPRSALMLADPDAASRFCQ